MTEDQFPKIGNDFPIDMQDPDIEMSKLPMLLGEEKPSEKTDLQLLLLSSRKRGGLTIPQLKDLLRERDLPLGGTKPELVNRLLKNM